MGRKKRAVRWIARTLGLALLLPIDCFFCLYDVLAVNLKKLRSEHRPRCPLARMGLCRACQKYANRWLFRLVCRDVQLSDRKNQPACGAGEDVHVYPVRGIFAAVVMLALFGGGLTSVVVFWPELNPPQQDQKAVQKLLDERIKLAEQAFSRQDHQKALELYKKALTQENRPDLRCRAGRCLEELGKQDAALEQYARALQGDRHAPEAAQKLAVAAYRDGRFLRAGQLARQALQGDIEDEALHAIAADSYELQGQTEKADRHLAQAHAETSENPLIGLVHARSFVFRGDLDRAESRLQSVKGTWSASLPAKLCRADLYWRRGDRQAAIEEVKNLLGRQSDAAGGHALLVELLLSAGRTGEALERVESVREDYSYAQGLLLRIARVLHQYGHAGLALELALEVRGEESTGLAAHLLAGEIYLSRGLPHRAAHHAEQALKESPDNAEALLLAGKAAATLGRTDDARDRLERAMEERPEDSRAPYMLAGVLMSEGRVKEAVSSLEKACELNPKSGDIRYEYGEALLEAGRRQAAAAEFETAARQMRNPVKPLTRLGMLAQQDGDVETAMDYYSRAVGADLRRSVVASNNYANLLLQQGENKTMAVALAYSARANATSSEIVMQTADTLAKALIETNNAPTALAPARQAAEGKPEDPARQLRLGVAEIAAGNQQQAAEALKKAQELAKSEEIKQKAKELLQGMRSPETN